jgi:hypothetical protein
VCAFSELSLTASIAADQAKLHVSLSLSLSSSPPIDSLLTKTCQHSSLLLLAASFAAAVAASAALHCKGVSDVSGERNQFSTLGADLQTYLTCDSRLLLLPNLAGQILSPFPHVFTTFSYTT